MLNTRSRYTSIDSAWLGLVPTINIFLRSGARGSQKENSRGNHCPLLRILNPNDQFGVISVCMMQAALHELTSVIKSHSACLQRQKPFLYQKLLRAYDKTGRGLTRYPEYCSHSMSGHSLPELKGTKYSASMQRGCAPSQLNQTIGAIVCTPMASKTVGQHSSVYSTFNSLSNVGSSDSGFIACNTDLHF